MKRLFCAVLMFVSSTVYAADFDVRSTTSVQADVTNDTSVSVNIAAYSDAAAQIVWSNHSDTSTFVLQTTIDGSNWNNIAGTTNITAASYGATTISLDSVDGASIRLKVTEADANTDASLVPHFVMRK